MKGHPVAMTNASALVVFMLAGWGLPAFAALEIRSQSVPQNVFSGPDQQSRIEFHNPTDRPIELKLRTRLHQASTATLMPIGEPQPWKTLAVLPRQTVLETLTLELPEVRAVTLFQVHWLDEKRTLLGETELMVYPNNVLKQLSTLSQEKPIGLLDPNRQLSPVLLRQKVELQILQTSVEVEDFPGRLVLVGPFSNASQVTHDFPELNKRITAKAKAGGRIVWLQPPSANPEPSPPLYTLPVGPGIVVIAPASTVADFATSPASQLNLVHFTELALGSNSLHLPKTER